MALKCVHLSAGKCDDCNDVLRARLAEVERDHALARSIRAQDAADLARKQRDHWRRRAEKAEAHLARILAKEGGNTL